MNYSKSRPHKKIRDLSTLTKRILIQEAILLGYSNKEIIEVMAHIDYQKMTISRMIGEIRHAHIKKR